MTHELINSLQMSRRRLLVGTGAAAFIAAAGVAFDVEHASAATGYRHPLDGDWYIPEGGEWHAHDGIHEGVDYDITGGSSGAAVHAIADGYVQIVSTGMDRYGKAIIIRHDDGMWSLYAHMAELSPLNVGDRVAEGAALGTVGSTGLSMMPHLHLELATAQSRLSDAKTTIDPVAYIDAHSAGAMRSSWINPRRPTGRVQAT